ncbi:hypothetical protein BDY24DRAFT_391294 [Mrakia frigida]|uniref:GNAT family N-acetyltransferase n=1 Tax=Mrakia frigida TaxID=29902 RepID=UPI003FCC0F50
MPPPRPQVLISPTTPSDYETVADVFLRSFQHGQIMCSVRPPSLRPSYSTQIALNVQARTKRASEPPGDLVEVKAIIGKKIVGAAVWHSPVDRTSTEGDPLPHEVEIEDMLAEQQRREGSAEWELEMDKTVDQEFYSGFVKTITEVRKEWSKGRPHWYLSYLFVDPYHQGSGVGTALIAYGTDRADAAGVPTWLEASIFGRPIYERKGFVAHSWCEVKGEQFEGGSLRWPGMERIAKLPK